jgi:hypothetical protein
MENAFLKKARVIGLAFFIYRYKYNFIDYGKQNLDKTNWKV